LFTSISWFVNQQTQLEAYPAEDFPVNDSRGKALQSSSAASPCQDVGNLQDPSGWWFFATPLKNMKVSWDDYPQYMET